MTAWPEGRAELPGIGNVFDSKCIRVSALQELTLCGMIAIMSFHSKDPVKHQNLSNVRFQSHPTGGRSNIPMPCRVTRHDLEKDRRAIIPSNSHSKSAKLRERLRGIIQGIQLAILYIDLHLPPEPEEECNIIRGVRHFLPKLPGSLGPASTINGRSFIVKTQTTCPNATDAFYIRCKFKS